MLKHNEVNPLSVFGLRMVEHCPPHFTPVAFDLRVSQKEITDWVWEHLDGRFYIGDVYSDTAGGSVTVQKVICFEEPGEASYFALMLTTVNTRPESSF